MPEVGKATRIPNQLLHNLAPNRVFPFIVDSTRLRELERLPLADFDLGDGTAFNLSEPVLDE